MKVYYAYFIMLIYGILRVFVQYMQNNVAVRGNVDTFQGFNNQHHSKIVDSYPFCGVVVFSLSLVQWMGLNVGIYFSESIKDLQLHMFFTVKIILIEMLVFWKNKLKLKSRLVLIDSA